MQRGKTKKLDIFSFSTCVKANEKDAHDLEDIREAFKGIGGRDLPPLDLFKKASEEKSKEE